MDTGAGAGAGTKNDQGMGEERHTIRVMTMQRKCWRGHSHMAAMRVFCWCGQLGAPCTTPRRWF